MSGGKPVLISEWFFAARQNRTGNLNNGHLMTVETQAERAAGAAAATENFAAIPEVIGAHWFQYYDHPKGGRDDGEDYDFGLVDINDQPYRRLTAALAIANRRAYEIHERSDGPDVSGRAVFAIPRAEVELRSRSLSDWPKPASLLPRLTASPGAVEFGEAYLSWSERGLQLATIGQDYFDIDLLAYDGPFPLERCLSGRVGRRSRRRAAALHAVLHPAAHQDPRLSGNGRRALRRSRATGDQPGLHPASPAPKRSISAPTSRASPPRR